MPSTISSTRKNFVETALWLSLLRAGSGFEPFMKRSQGKVSGNAVAAFLILEPRFLRSIRYCVHSAYERLCAIRPPEDEGIPGGQTLERLRVLDEWLGEMRGESLDPHAVHEVLTHVVDETAGVCNDLAREVFGYGAAAIPAPAPSRRQSQSQSQTQGTAKATTDR